MIGRTMGRTILCLAALAGPATLAAQGTIAEVTVFEDRARAVRSVPVTLAAGPNRIEVPELPISLAANSVLAEVSGIEADVLGVRLDRVVHEDDIRAEVRALEEAHRENRRAEAEARAAVEVAHKRRQLADEFAKYLRRALLERSATADAAESEVLVEADGWISARWLEAQDAIAAAEQRIEELLRRRQEIEENLARRRAGARRVTFTAVVQVEASAEGAGTLRLGYDVPHARWRPVYEARLDEASGTVAWTYGAEIVQESGEDWDAVALTLSTQRSSLGMTPPRLVPQRVDGRSTERRDVGVASESAPASSLAPSEASAGSEGEAEDLSRATIEDAGRIARFRIAVPATIPADGRTHRVPVLAAELPVDLAFECIPRLSPHTYRRGRLENRTEAPFLPGVVRVFREGSYVGETELDTVAPSGSFRLGFGVEGRIVVQRTELTDRERETGSFRKSDRRIVGHRFTVRSALPEPTSLVLVDRVPVSEIEGIEVETTNRCDPLPGIDRDGICRWELALEPGGERTVIFEYRVTAPSGSAVPLDAIE